MSKQGSESPAQDGAAGDAAGKDALFENRGPKKIIRIITVMAYMFSVSFVAIVLSAYYLFLWEPPNPRLLHRTSRLRGGGGGPYVQFLIDSPPSLRRLSKHEIDEMGHKLLKEEKLSTPMEEEIRIRGRIVDDEEFSSKLIRKNTFTNNVDESLASLRSTLIDILRARSNDNETDEYFTVSSSNSVNDNSEEATVANVSEDNATSSVATGRRNETYSKNKGDISWIFKNITNSASEKIATAEERSSSTSADGANEEISSTTVEPFGTRPFLNFSRPAHVLARKNERSNKEKLSILSIFREKQSRTSEIKRQDAPHREEISRENGSTENGSGNEFYEEANSTETQIEKMTTTKSITGNGDLQRSEIPSTTAGYKGLLRILTETAESASTLSPTFSSTISMELESHNVTITEPSKIDKTRN